MSDWQITLAMILGGAAVGLLYNINSRVEAMSRLMHEQALAEHERRSSN